MSEGKSPAPEMDAQAREVRITGKIVWSTSGLDTGRKDGKTGVFTGTVPERLLAENEESGSRVD